MKTSVSFLGIILTFISCNSNQVATEYQNIFAIYLLKDPSQSFVSPSSSLEDLVLDEKPLLTANQIDEYDWHTHSIAFPSNTKEELKLREPLLHRRFVVIANDIRIYWGRFMDDLDSDGCQNPVIRLLPRNPNINTFIPDGFCIDRAYPQYFGNEGDPDIRNDTRVFAALQGCGKVKD